MNGHDAPDAGLLRDQIHTQVYSFSCDVIKDKLLIVAWMLQPKLMVFLVGSLCSSHFFSRSKSGAGVRALASHQCTRFRILASTSYVFWVCCWLSPLLLDFFLRVRRFYLLLKNQRFQIPIRSGTHGHVSTSFYELQSTPWVKNYRNYNARVAGSLCFKARLSAKPLMWFFFSNELKSFSQERFCT